MIPATAGEPGALRNTYDGRDISTSLSNDVTGGFSRLLGGGDRQDNVTPEMKTIFGDDMSRMKDYKPVIDALNARKKFAQQRIKSSGSQ